MHVLTRCAKSIFKGFANKLCIALFVKKSRKYPSNGFANKVYNLINFVNTRSILKKTDVLDMIALAKE